MLTINNIRPEKKCDNERYIKYTIFYTETKMLKSCIWFRIFSKSYIYLNTKWETERDACKKREREGIESVKEKKAWK